MTDTVLRAVARMVEPILVDLGLELYDLEFAGGTLKVTIDTPAGGPSGVDIDKIALVNRTLGRTLDHDDVIPGRYVLEVTSPGLERTLRTPAHFAREAGKTVSIRLTAPLEGRRRLNGVLVASTGTEFTVRLADSGESVTVPIASVERAKTVFVWETQPKPNSPEAREARRRGRADQQKVDTLDSDSPGDAAPGSAVSTGRQGATAP